MKRLYLSPLLILAMLFSAQAQEPDKAKPDVPKKEAPKPEFGRGHRPLTPERKRQLHAWAKENHGHRIARHMMFQTLPATFDCADKGWMSPVGDQGSCGSCYLYSTTQNMTDAFIRAGFGKADGSFLLAPQFGMDCHDFGGCNGGNGNEVVDWACKNGWYAEKWVDLQGQSHSEYPAYEARSGRCRVPSGARKWTPATWGYVTADQSDRPPTVEEVKTALYNYGTLNIALDAGGQFGSGTDTITHLGSNIDHEIRCTAYDDDHDNGDGTKGAVKFVNQWTKKWGNNGTRWASYKVVPKLVSVFWVSAGPLPPPVPPIPPVPPVPPVPGLAPVITSPLTATAATGAAFSYQIAATNAPAVFYAIGLPAGLACSQTGTISGIPTAAGVTSITIGATNLSGATTATLVLTVHSPGPSNVSLVLTPEQIQSVIDQSGTVAVTPEMTVGELLKAVGAKKCCDKLPVAPAQSVPPPTAPDTSRLDALLKRLDSLDKKVKRLAPKKPGVRRQ